jgi:glycosyltransferase involved in cell wall biosynthesis
MEEGKIHKSNKLVTLTIFTYNQEKFIREAVEGALNQTYSPLEIIISDDCSSDSTFNIIRGITSSYSGPHKIIINRNEKNLGLGGHFSNVCYSMATGEYIVTCAGDDISQPEHVEKAIEAMNRFPNINMIDFSGYIINENSEIIGSSPKHIGTRKYTLNDFLLVKPIRTRAPGRILKANFLHSFPPISANCPTEDSILTFRALLTGGLIRTEVPLVLYRKHDNNISNLTGLKKLSNQAIIAQQITDLCHFYNESKKLSEKQFETILKRLLLELKMRTLSYANSNLKIVRLYNKLYKGIVIIFFKSFHYQAIQTNFQDK